MMMQHQPSRTQTTRRNNVNSEVDHHHDTIPKAVNINTNNNSKEEAPIMKLATKGESSSTGDNGYGSPDKTVASDMDATETTTSRSATPDPTTSSYEDEMDIHSLVLVNDNDGQQQQQQYQQSEPELFCELRDVLIVVGGQNFWEHSTLLRCCSEYFDDAMSMMMMSGDDDDHHIDELRFDFPDKRAEEWKLVQELMQPYSREQISMSNMQQLLPWLDTLRIRRGLDQCDHVLCEELGSKSLRALELANNRKHQSNNNNNQKKNKNNEDPSARQQLQELNEYMELMLEGLMTSSQYNLRASKGMLLGIIGRIVQDHSMVLSRKDCETIGYLLSTDEECRYQLWDKISMYLPANFPSDADSAVIMIDTQPEVFQASLYNGIQAQKSLNDLNWLEKKALRWLQNRSNRRQQQQQQQQQNEMKKKDKEGKE